MNDHPICFISSVRMRYQRTALKIYASPIFQIQLVLPNEHTKRKDKRNFQCSTAKRSHIGRQTAQRRIYNKHVYAKNALVKRSRCFSFASTPFQPASCFRLLRSCFLFALFFPLLTFLHFVLRGSFLFPFLPFPFLFSRTRTGSRQSHFFDEVL